MNHNNLQTTGDQIVTAMSSNIARVPIPMTTTPRAISLLRTYEDMETILKPAQLLKRYNGGYGGHCFQESLGIMKADPCC